MKKYCGFLLLVVSFFLFSFNINALTGLNNDKKGAKEDNNLQFVINGTTNETVNPEGRDINDNNVTNDNNVDENRNADGLYNTTDNNDNNGILENNDLNNNNLNDNNDTDDTDDVTFNESNFLTTLSSGIIGGLIGSAIIFLLVVRKR